MDIGAPPDRDRWFGWWVVCPGVRSFIGPVGAPAVSGSALCADHGGVFLFARSWGLAPLRGDWVLLLRKVVARYI